MQRLCGGDGVPRSSLSGWWSLSNHHLILVGCHQLPKALVDLTSQGAILFIHWNGILINCAVAVGSEESRVIPKYFASSSSDVPQSTI